MAAVDTNPWELDPARVPSYADLGSPAFKNATGDRAPKDDGTMPEAKMFMRLFEAALSAGNMTPSLRVTIRFNAGAPFVDSFIAPGLNISTADIGCVDNATGDTTVRVRASKLPTKRTSPSVDVHEGTSPSVTVADYEATDSEIDYRGARVKTWVSGSLANCGFTVTIY